MLSLDSAHLTYLTRLVVEDFFGLVRHVWKKVNPSLISWSGTPLCFVFSSFWHPPKYLYRIISKSEFNIVCPHGIKNTDSNGFSDYDMRKELAHSAFQRLFRLHEE
jgi:hypothetical protein